MFVDGSVELSVAMINYLSCVSICSHRGPQLALRCRLGYCLECWAVNLTGQQEQQGKAQANLLDISKSFESDCSAVADLFADPY
jgi:hypothetical protein